MAPDINETHDAQLRTWVPSTLPDAASFPIQNLPYGRFISPRSGRPAPCVAIGDSVLDLEAAVLAGALDGKAAEAVAACRLGWLNDLMALPRESTSALRLSLSRILRKDSRVSEALKACLSPRQEAHMLKPVDVRNFSDFFTSVNHARNSGKLKRPDNPLFANFHSLPVAYHGRASTLVVSGTEFARPMGQFLPEGSSQPVFKPSEAVDFECELGVYVGKGNALGERISLQDAPDHIFGFSILNDWSARDIQSWESAPLGPFLAKSFISTLSPWVVTLEALAPFRIPAAPREAGTPELLSHLNDPKDRAKGGLSLEFEVRLLTPTMRAAGEAATLISQPQFKDQYWTAFQMLTHQTSNGCVVETGDLLGTGTISGPNSAELGCLMELTLGGKRKILLPNGESRGYLEDGDELIISAQATAPSCVSIGFGRSTGRVLAARA
ncbi:Fumarylacetoacetate (FAA) hydrolase family protein [Xylophilus ampelinus]|uniref:fumarylacetoacetase n=1 Tax=Variovorax paradoxus TaxID=34073 RepID=A0A2W5QU13_VARPD|nr:MAG: fumarylacetoacetase [Variovorax paradoxus]VTY40203.1 Fumarylacetoacetate (FAA) hydrolase family protein [Xylophilus ampelinus]